MAGCWGSAANPLIEANSNGVHKMATRSFFIWISLAGLGRLQPIYSRFARQEEMLSAWAIVLSGICGQPKRRKLAMLRR